MGSKSALGNSDRMHAMKSLPLILLAAVVASVATTYVLRRTQDAAGAAAPGVHIHALELADVPDPGALKVKKLNSVQLDYTFTYGVYQRRGYAACPASAQRAYLQLRRPVKCRELFEEVLADQSGQLLPAPPKWMPPIYHKEYLLDGSVDLLSWSITEVYNGNPDPLSWTEEHLDDMTNRAGKKEYLSYGEWSHSVYNALASVDLAGKKGLVVGSETPWVEAAILHRGAAHVTTSEYRQIKSGHPKHSAYHPREQAKQFLDGKLEPFDFAFSFSSLEHSGLGRYGDPLDPNGDLKETTKLSCLVKPGGLLFLGLPFNVDAVVWNAHRLYGPVRLPLVTANWGVQNIFSKDSEKPIENLTPYFFRDERDDWQTQLVVVAKNNRETPCS